MDLRATYDAVVELKDGLEQSHDDLALGRPDYRRVKALAACYELQDYLAGQIALASEAGELEPDMEG